MIIAIISGVIALIALIILIVKINLDNLLKYDIKITQVSTEIQLLLEKKMSLLGSLQSEFAKDSSEKEFTFLCDLNEIEENDFKLNTILNKASKELKDFLDDKRSYIPSDEIKSLLEEFQQIEIECTATKNYYNDNAIILNNKIKKFPNNLIAKLKRINEKELYNDPVEEEFEILKKK